MHHTEQDYPGACLATCDLGIHLQSWPCRCEPTIVLRRQDGDASLPVGVVTVLRERPRKPRLTLVTAAGAAGFAKMAASLSPPSSICCSSSKRDTQRSTSGHTSCTQCSKDLSRSAQWTLSGHCSLSNRKQVVGLLAQRPPCLRPENSLKQHSF